MALGEALAHEGRPVCDAAPPDFINARCRRRLKKSQKHHSDDILGCVNEMCERFAAQIVPLVRCIQVASRSQAVHSRGWLATGGPSVSTRVSYSAACRVGSSSRQYTVTKAIP